MADENHKRKDASLSGEFTENMAHTHSDWSRTKVKAAKQENCGPGRKGPEPPQPSETHTPIRYRFHLSCPRPAVRELRGAGQDLKAGQANPDLLLA